MMISYGGRFVSVLIDNEVVYSLMMRVCVV